jgi:hypothetical protein
MSENNKDTPIPLSPRILPPRGEIITDIADRIKTVEEIDDEHKITKVDLSIKAGNLVKITDYEITKSPTQNEKND